MLFSIHRDGRQWQTKAIFHPWWTEKWPVYATVRAHSTGMDKSGVHRLFSVHSMWPAIWTLGYSLELSSGLCFRIRVTVLGFWLVFSVVTVAGICNSVGGDVLFNIPPRWRWRILVQYAPCIAGEGQSSVPFPSPHASSCRTRQLLPSLLIIRQRDANDRRDDRRGGRSHDQSLRRSSRSTAHKSTDCTSSLGTKHFSATPLY